MTSPFSPRSWRSRRKRARSGSTAYDDSPWWNPSRLVASSAVNVHESARLALRKAMANRPDGKFRSMSARAVNCFRDDPTAAMRIEWIYHLLCADPELGATELEKLDRDWSSQARPEERAALATTLNELQEASLVAGRARVWVLLVVAWYRQSRGEDAQLGEAAVEALALARSVRDAAAEADSQALLGRVLESQGKLGDAQIAYEEALAISQRLADHDPGNTGRQRELAAAHSRVGGVQESRGRSGRGGGVVRGVPGDLPAAGRARPQQRRLAAGAWRWRTAASAACRSRAGGCRRRRRRSGSPWRSAVGWPSSTPATPAGSGTWRWRTAASAACRSRAGG